jgi:hypothetical protein
MKKFSCIVIALFTVTAGFVSAGGSGDYEEFDGYRHYSRLSRFDGVDLRIEASVTLQQGSDWEVRARGSKADLDDLDIFVSGGILVIKRVSFLSFVPSDRRIDIDITLPTLREVKISGSGEVRSADYFETGDLRLSIPGSGEIDIEATATDLVTRVSGSGVILFRGRADTLDASISGSGENDFDVRVNVAKVAISGAGDALLRGDAEDLTVKISGSGELDAVDFPVRRAEVTITGSGDVEVQAAQSLTVRISGSGNLYYRGSPEKVDYTISGSGQIVGG